MTEKNNSTSINLITKFLAHQLAHIYCFIKLYEKENILLEKVLKENEINTKAKSYKDYLKSKKELNQYKKHLLYYLWYFYISKK